MSESTAPEPLQLLGSIKVKLGVLVAASVLVATVLSRVGADTVPALLSIPITVLLALGVTQLLAVGMTLPLRQMIEAARRMAGGDYDVRVQTGSRDEVGELARAFNRMAADLAAVDRQRRELVANVSHELRTPLAALVAVLENLADGVTPPDPEQVRPALAQAERLSTLVADLLDLARVDAGVVPLALQDLELREVVLSAIAHTPARPGTDIDVDVPDGLTLRADPARLQQLLVNLLDNALRHSPPGGRVQVQGEQHAGGVRIEVLDEGPGVAPGDRDRVFERFGTVEGASAGTGGTGLGLAIARWVTDLHGGRIDLVDPPEGRTGARFRVDLPAATGDAVAPETIVPETAAPETVAPESAAPATAAPEAAAAAAVVPATQPAPATRRTTPAPRSGLDLLFGDLWPERGVRARRDLLLGSMLVGLLAAVALPDNAMGLGLSLVLLSGGGLVFSATSGRRDPFVLASAALCVGFAVLASVRDAAWVVVLGVLVSLVLVSAALISARTARTVLAAIFAWPLAGLRGMPWLGRTLRTLSGGTGGAALARTIVLSAVGVLVFGALLASGDAIVGTWIRALVPTVGDLLVLRVFVGVAVAGMVLAAAYLALNPPTLSGPGPRRPAQHRFEWLVPVLLIDAVFVVFLVAQAAAFLGGHDYVRSVTGLSYADYVHQGFGQLTVATALTLLVTSAASARADRASAADRWWLRVSVGALNLLTLVVVASALHRMALYQEAYGFTRLRLLVDVFEAWLGLVVVGVLVAGIRLNGWWLPRAALLSGAAALLGLGVADPDAWIARHNLERYETTGKVDDSYLKGLSADAVPTLVRLRPEVAACWREDRPGPAWTGWAEWNLGRVRADDALATLPESVPCLTDLRAGEVLVP